MQTTKKQLRIYANALIKAVCESKLDAKVDFTQKWISLWVFGEDSVKFSLDIFVEGYTRKEIAQILDIDMCEFFRIE